MEVHWGSGAFYEISSTELDGIILAETCKIPVEPLGIPTKECRRIPSDDNGPAKFQGSFGGLPDASQSMFTPV